jgi:hypothetical protein
MVIWVSGPDKQVLGYLSVEDFCAMTDYPMPPDGRGIKDGVEVYRTEQYIFGALRTSKHQPTLRWSQEHQLIEPLPPRSS